MNGTTGTSNISSSTTLAPATIAFLASNYILSVAAMVLNGLEIYILRKRWQTVTDFELVLFNLAITDSLTGVFFLATTGVETHWSGTGNYVPYPVEGTFYLLTFIGVMMSVNFVILVGIERLFAIRLPIQHRMFHMKRRKVYGGIALVWVITILIGVIAVTLDQVLNEGIADSYGSVSLGYAFGGFLTFQSVIIIILYSSVAFHVVRRRSKFKKLNRDTIRASKKNLVAGWRKERATLVVCLLVVVSFLACTAPFTTVMLKGKNEDNETIFLLANSVINPLIYFFKGFVENRFQKRKTGDLAFKINEEKKKARRLQIVGCVSNAAFVENTD